MHRHIFQYIPVSGWVSRTSTFSAHLVKSTSLVLNFACISRGSSPTSSRKIVPRWQIQACFARTIASGKGAGFINKTFRFQKEFPVWHCNWPQQKAYELVAVLAYLGGGWVLPHRKLISWLKKSGRNQNSAYEILDPGRKGEVSGTRKIKKRRTLRKPSAVLFKPILTNAVNWQYL